MSDQSNQFNQFTNAFNLSEEAILKLRQRTFELGGHTFKVRVPTNAEMKALTASMNEVSEEEVALCLSEVDQVDGQDIALAKEQATTRAKTKKMVLETFKFLVPETDFDMRNLTYDDIEDAFPFPIQVQVMNKISQSIGFDYDDAKKN